MGVQFPGKKRYVTLEWPHRHISGGKVVDKNRLLGNFFMGRFSQKNSIVRFYANLCLANRCFMNRALKC